jgi:hypothetical protein
MAPFLQNPVSNAPASATRPEPGEGGEGRVNVEERRDGCLSPRDVRWCYASDLSKRLGLNERRRRMTAVVVVAAAAVYEVFQRRRNRALTIAKQMNLYLLAHRVISYV